MAEPNEERTAERIDKLVGDVLAGRHLKATPGDAADREAIQVATRLAGVRDGYPRMSPAFRRRLAAMLESGERPGWLNRRAALVAGLGLAAGAVGAFLVRHGDQVVGMSSYCTHLPCELVWLGDKKLLNCPCHNLAFDIQGQSMQEGYALPALPWVTVRVRKDGRVEVLGT